MVNFNQVSWSVDFYLIAYIFLQFFSEQRGRGPNGNLFRALEPTYNIVSLTVAHSRGGAD